MYSSAANRHLIINSSIYSRPLTGADPGFGVRGDEIRQGDLRVLLLLSQMFMERMMQENFKID